MAKTQPNIDDIKGLTQWINFLWLKLKDLFSAESETTNDNYLPKIDDVNKKLVKSNISDDGTTPKYGDNTIWHSGNLDYGDLGDMPVATETKVGGVKLGVNVPGLDADLLDGNHASAFATSTHNHSTEYLGITEKSADSDKVDGKHASDFATSAQGEKADTAYANSHTHTNTTALNNVSGTNTGDETTQRIGTLINGAATKATPVNADMVGLMDSAASNILKKLSWANIKATLKTYFDTLYAKLSFASIKVGGVNVNATRESIVEFIAGTNVSLTANNTAKTITIAASETIQLLSSGGEILNYLTDGVYRLNSTLPTGNYPDSVCGTKGGSVTPNGTEILRQYTGNNGNHDVKTQIMLIQNETYRRSGFGNYWNEWVRLITCRDMADYVTTDMLETSDGGDLEPYNSVDVYRDTTYTIYGDAKEGKYIINLMPLFTSPPLEIIETYIVISPQNQADYTLEIQLSDYDIDTRESSSSTTAHFGDYASITIPQGTSFVLLKIYMFENVQRCLIIYTFS